MPIYANQLEAQLQRTLAPAYLLTGDEPLQLEECRDAIVRAARVAGFTERSLYAVETGFDWNELFRSSQSLSLFSEKRILDLRLPGGKPGEKGARVLEQMAAEPPADTLLIVSCGKLEKAVRESKWAKAIDKAGVTVAVYPVDAKQYPAWIARRLQARGVRADRDVIGLLAHHYEGNQLACAQEIDKLAMTFGDRPVQLADVEGVLADQARFDVFGLADSCLAGDVQTIPRILAGLKGEGTEPVLVLWALVREIRALAAMAAAVAGGQSAAAVLEQARVWPKRRPLVGKALTRHRATAWQDLLARAARTERVVKGRSRGDSWREIECLALGMGGLELPPCRRAAAGATL
jgi:DNA polymerase-3 subunit delta